MTENIKLSYERVIDTIEPIVKIEFGIHSNRDIIDYSVMDNPAGIIIAEINNNGEPVQGGVVNKKLGVTEMGVECDECGETSAKCPGHFGHIKMAEAVFHVGFLPYLKTILSCICIICNELLVHKNQDEIAKLLKYKHGKQRFDEIKTIVKGITHCNHCGTPAHKIKKETKYSNIYLIAEPARKNGEDSASNKKNVQQFLTPQLCYDILHGVTDENYRIMGFDPTKAHPKDMVIINFPVPPVQVRPSIKIEIMTSSSIDDDLTHKLMCIVRSNNNLKDVKGDGSLTKGNMMSEDYTLLQYHVATFFNNNSIGMPRSLQKNKKQTKSISERLSGKEGRIRRNLMGKRVDFSGRTVITPDPNIALNEVGIPLIIAKNLTYPEVVSEHNIRHLEKLVKNGRDIYPGANWVKKMVVGPDGVEVRPFQLKKYIKGIKLEIGDIVERHLVNGDMVLFNRQPSLHKLSMMGHKAHILLDPDMLTFRVNPSVTEPYNADFDGDEMNIHIPQSLCTVVELRMIPNAGKRLIKQANSEIAMGVKQDTIMGLFQLSNKDKPITMSWKTAMNIQMVTHNHLIGTIKKGEIVTGKELYSQIIPKDINFEKRKDDGSYILKVLNGNIIEGLVGKSEIKNILHKIWFTVGEKESVYFIDDLQRLILQWLVKHGFSTGIGDCIIPKIAHEQLETIIETKRKEILGMITEYENEPGIMTKYAHESTIVAHASAVQGDLQTVIQKNFNLDGGIHVTVQSGSAGDIGTATQIIGAVGQQIVESQRMRKGYNGRTLPMFWQNDNSMFAGGFIRHSFTDGLDPPEFFFSAVSGREGLIATAIKSVTGDTQIVIIENNQAKQVMIGDWIDQQLEKSADKVEHYVEREMELLQLDHEVSIPTCDEKGNVTWGEITAITRHDPGKELYEIKTKGGRKVIVTESKSLLVWDGTKFERMSTPEVKVGDFVPVTMNSKRFFPKKFFSFNGDDLGRALANHDDFVITIIKKYLKSACIKDGQIKILMIPSSISKFMMLLTRFGIFSETKDNYVIIKGKWAQKCKDIFSLRGESIFEETADYQEQNDVILDQIIEINKVDVSKYPKVYDLTVPSTLNFGLANGLHVVDTADTGYLERKLIKILEDIRVAYDGTIRNANDKVIQYVYGDNGINTERQIEQKIRLIVANNHTVHDKYTYSDKEIDEMHKKGTTSKYTKETNEMLYDKLIGMRDQLRKLQKYYTTSNIVFKESFMMPVDLNQYIINIMSSPERSNKTIVDPYYVVTTIKKMYDSSMTKIMVYNDKAIQKKNDEKRHKYLLKFYLFDVLSPKRCTHEYQLSKTEFDNIVDYFAKRLKLAIIDSGEMVGIVVAQSIGEPLSQSNLKSFHSAGTGKTVTAELPRVKELLSVTPNIKTPVMQIIFEEKYKTDKEFVTKVASYLRSIVIKDIVDQVDIIYDPKPKSGKGLSAKDNVDNIFEVSQSKFGCSNEISGLPWVIRLVLSKEKMNDLNVTMLEVKTGFCKNWANRYEDVKGSKKDFKKVIDKIQQCAIVSNYDNSLEPIIHIRFESNNYGFNVLTQFQELVVGKYVIKGLNKITGNNDIQEESYVTFDNEGNKVIKKQYVIYTDGVNLRDIASINGIDLLETTCNDIVAVYEKYGINAAKNAFIKEFNLAVSSSGGVANYQHVKILADTITQMGTLNAVNRHGANKLDTDPLSRASFEKTVEQMLAAAAFSQTDYIRSVSARIMVGALVNGGTGSFDLLLDHEKLKRYLTPTRQVKETITMKKRTVVSDLIKKKSK